MTHRTLSDALDEYLAMTQGRYAQRTRDNRALILRAFVKDVGDIQVRHLAQHHLERYFYAAKHGAVHKYAPRTVNLIRSNVTGFVRFMQNRGWLRTEVMENIRVARVVHRERVRLSAKELLSCLDLAGHPRDRAFLALLVNTGLRVSEVLDLKIGDLNMDLLELRVRIFKTYAEDTMMIFSDLEAELQTWLKFYGDRVTLEPGHYLIPAKTTVVPVKLGTVEPTLLPERKMAPPYRLLRDLFIQLGIDPKGEGAHTFRRSVARLYYDRLLDTGTHRDDAIRRTEALLHHSSLQTTELYLGLTREREARDRDMRGQPFLTAIVAAEAGNVVRLEAVGGEGRDNGV